MGSSADKPFGLLYFFGFLHLRVALAASRFPPQAHLARPSSTCLTFPATHFLIHRTSRISSPYYYHSIAIEFDSHACPRQLRIMSEESPAPPAVAADAGDSRAAAAESEPAQKQGNGKPSETEEKEKPTGNYCTNGGNAIAV